MNNGFYYITFSFDPTRVRLNVTCPFFFFVFLSVHNKRDILNFTLIKVNVKKKKTIYPLAYRRRSIPKGRRAVFGG